MNTLENKELYIAHFDELRKRIIAKNLHKPVQIYGIICISVTILLYVIGVLLIGKIPVIVTVIYFYLVSIELAFISHDLIHNQYFKNPKHNLFFSYISANLFIGLSRSWWAKKHNSEHHIFTNSDIHDTDIRDYDEIFTKNEGKIPFFHKYKQILFWPTTMLVYFNLVILSYIFIIKNKKYLELVLSIIGTLFLPTVLIYSLGLSTGIIAAIGVYVLVGVHLGFVFMTNHLGMEVIDGNKIREYAWFDLQTRTSRNISGGECVNQIFGGLNKQIEHHLFPQVSRYHIRAVAKEVKSYCQEQGITYHDVTFFQSLREIYTTLRTGNTV